VLSTQWYAACEDMDCGASSGERAGFQLFTLTTNSDERGMVKTATNQNGDTPKRRHENGDRLS